MSLENHVVENYRDVTSVGHPVWSTAQLFVLAYVHEKVVEWVSVDTDSESRLRKQRIMHELDANQEMSMEIFESVVLQCEIPLTERDFRWRFVRQIHDIETLLLHGSQSASEAWGLLKKHVVHGEGEYAGRIWYDMTSAIQEQRKITNERKPTNQAAPDPERFASYPGSVDGLLCKLRAFVV